VPAVLVATSTSQSLAAKQWGKFYHKGHALGPTLAILGAGTFGWLAFKSHNMLYWGAAAFDIGLIPWTLLFMMKTTNSLLELVGTKDEKSTANDGTRFTPLVNTWASLNIVRSIFPFVGGILGLMAALP
jgi:hypothetical protein